jgi:hypothetical protein
MAENTKPDHFVEGKKSCIKGFSLMGGGGGIPSTIDVANGKIVRVGPYNMTGNTIRRISIPGKWRPGARSLNPA